jgi:hypothetical protein
MSFYFLKRYRELGYKFTAGFYFFWLVLEVFNFSGNSISAQNIWLGYENLFTSVRNYSVYKTNKQIDIDGKPNEYSWENCPWSDIFTDIQGTSYLQPYFSTRFKMLWDSSFLYIYAELEEPQIWSYYNQHDMIVYHEPDFEIFLNNTNDSRNYFEIEVNAINTIFDLFMTQPYRDGGIPLITWDVKELDSRVVVKGTINNPSDIDTSWSIEMKIPFASLQVGLQNPCPHPGTIWKMNFSRVEWDTEIESGKYFVKKDKNTGRKLPEHNWVWSPQGIIDMHYPERWGNICFSGEEANNAKLGNNENFSIPIINNLIWLIYYKQRDFMRKNNRYARNIKELKLPKVFDQNDMCFVLSIEGTSNQYIAKVVDSVHNRLVSITEKGWLFQN